MSSGLKVEKLTFEKILKEINLNLEEGTINALIGKSGSGKTQLLKSLAGLIDYEGTIIYNEMIITKDNMYDIRKNRNIFRNKKFRK